MLVTSSLSMMSSLRLAGFDLPWRLASRWRRSSLLLSSSGSKNFLVFSPEIIDVSEFRLSRRSRTLAMSGGSAKMSSCPIGPRDRPAMRSRSSLEWLGRCPGGGILPYALGGMFSGLRLMPFV
jgi:hypothetical protein